LARVIAEAYGRSSAALLLAVPQGLRHTQERAVVNGAEWLAQYGHLGVWLAGGPLQNGDRVRTVPVVLPASMSALAAEALRARSVESATDPTSVATLRYAPIAGRPRNDSDAELKLERALAAHDWAQGRQWNRRYEWHLLAKPYRLDLFWPEEGVVVEVDGPEHRGVVMYADDRRRDVQLQLLGHDVLRFTNEQVLFDVGAVVTRIEQILTMRRAAGKRRIEERQHVHS
jgi:very-short-patch-repair endonuclease